MFHPYWVGQTNENADRRVYTWLEDARQLTRFSGYSEFFLRYVDVNTSEAQSDDLMRTIARETNYIPTAAWQDDPDDYTLIREVQNVTNILTLLAIVALVVSGFLVTNVINTIVVEQKGQIGVLKSVGATRWTRSSYSPESPRCTASLGTIPGVILGVIAGSFMAEQVAPFASPSSKGFNVSVTGIIVGAAMGILCRCGPRWCRLQRTRVSIREAMTDLGISSRWGTASGAPDQRPAPSRSICARRSSNVSQKKSGCWLTVITLTLAAAHSWACSPSSPSSMTRSTMVRHVQLRPGDRPHRGAGLRAGERADRRGRGHRHGVSGVGFNVRVLDLSGTSPFIGAQGQKS